MRIMRFCSAGTAALPTSTARSPRATMMPSDASMISASAVIASARSILAMSSASPPAARSSWRAMYMSSLVLRERYRQVVGLDLRGGLHVVHVLGGERRRGEAAALAVDALVVRQHAADLDARRDRASGHRLHAQADQPVVEQQDRAGRDVAAAAPCSRGRRAARRRASHAASRMNVDPVFSVTLPSSNLPTRIFGPCRSAMMRDCAAEPASRVAHHAGARLVIGGGAVREIQSHDVDAGAEHARRALPASCWRGRAWRRSWWRAAWVLLWAATLRDQPLARDSSMATAGSVLPSRNSRNAPPAVEM